MRTIQILTILFSIIILACDKYEDLCIKEASFNSEVGILNKTDLIKAQSLFDLNNLNYSNKRFTSVTETETNIIVKGYQYINGIKVFTEPLSYFFQKSMPQRFDFILGDTLLPASISLGTIPQMDKKTVISLSKSIIEADDKIDWNGSLCYVVEFGYYDLNVSTNLDQVDYFQAWKIYPEGGSVPLIYINDKTKELIYYDNGIRSQNFNDRIVHQTRINN